MKLAQLFPSLLRVAAGVMIATLPCPASAQHLAGGGSPDVSVIRIIAALAISLLVGAGLVMVQRRFPARNGRAQIMAALTGALARARRIDVIEARRISAHADLCLVRCDNDEYLIACGPGGLTVLRSGPVLPGPAAVAACEVPQ